MTFNRNIEATWRYHNLTKHSYQSIRADRHYLDWSNQPSPFKIYPEPQPIGLPVDFASSGVPALEALARADTAASNEVTIDHLASVLVYSAGVMKEKKYPGGEIYFRAAACAGALYPIEVYVVCGGVEGLAAGVYHFNPGDFALRQLRAGDFRRALARAAGDEVEISRAPVTLVYTAISWRSSWKYRARAYRYHFWDNGMIAANALAMAAALDLPASVVMGFVESEVNKLLGIDGEQELALSLLPIGRARDVSPECAPIEELSEITYEVIPLSASAVDYASIREMHRASSLTTPEEVREWREVTFQPPSIEAAGEAFPLAPPADDLLPREAIESVIERRASTRRFAPAELPFADLSVIIDRGTRAVPSDFSRGGGESLNDLYLIVNRVEGLPAGAYFYDRASRALELLKRGDFSRQAAYLALEQDLGGDASATIFFMARLDSVLAAFGNRGYRAAQMEAGIIGGKMYLASYAQRRGATGLTFFDDDVTEFFSPHASGKSCMLVVSVGLPGKRPLF
jgi:SagB-type dehydrogenase family enzyme